MRGTNSAAGHICVAMLTLTLIGWECSSSDEITRIGGPDTGLTDFLLNCEQTFNPSKYNAELGIDAGKQNNLEAVLRSATVFVSALPETIPGFRVQAFLTQEIEKALSVRDILSNTFQDDFVYMVYDAPYYKIRIGNYAERPAASPMVRRLTELGYKDAWIVPDNVLKNPPAKLPEQAIEPRNPLQRHE